jgi:hypothetical protein
LDAFVLYDDAEKRRLGKSFWGNIIKPLDVDAKATEFGKL